MSSATSSATPSGRRSWQGSSPLPEAGICIVNILCRPWRHHESALSFDAEKEGAGCDASVTGWRIGLILRAPCSAAGRALPRKTTCGGFWYFWPQKYMNNLFSFPLLFGGEKQQKASRSPFTPFGKNSFFPCFSMAKSSKSHPTDSDVGVRKSESGVGRLSAGLQANRPRRCRFQPSVRFFAIGTKSGIALRKKKKWSCEGGWFCETKVTRSRRRAGQVS